MNIPIYRAKKINSDEYIIGQYLPTYKTKRNEDGDNINEDEVLHHYLIKSISNAETDDEDRFDFWGFEEIDITTLAIHFPDMTDSQGNKIFASLSEDGKGGDIMKYDDYYGIAKYKDSRFVCEYENVEECLYEENFEVIGIQK